VSLALVCAFVSAFVSAFLCSFRGLRTSLFACVLSWVEICAVSVTMSSDRWIK
jgi:hypothetical protein